MDLRAFPAVSDSGSVADNSRERSHGGDLVAAGDVVGLGEHLVQTVERPCGLVQAVVQRHGVGGLRALSEDADASSP